MNVKCNDRAKRPISEDRMDKQRVCRWCGCLKRPRAGPRNEDDKRGYRCVNLDCPRRGQVAWKIPRMIRIVFSPPPYDDTSPGFDNAVRAMEDGLE